MSEGNTLNYVLSGTLAKIAVKTRPKSERAQPWLRSFEQVSDWVRGDYQGTSFLIPFFFLLLDSFWLLFEDVDES